MVGERRSSDRGERAAGAAETRSRRMIQIYLPDELRDQVRRIQDDEELSNAEMILTAIEATHQDLRVRADPRPGALFSRDYRPRKQSQDRIVQVGVRLLNADINQIDSLVSTSRTDSRSAYIVAALKAYVAQRQHPREDEQ